MSAPPGWRISAGNGLSLVLGPSGNRRFPLTPFNRNLFVYNPFGETRRPRMGVTCLIGADGHASAITIEDLNGSSLGTLARFGRR